MSRNNASNNDVGRRVTAAFAAIVVSIGVSVLVEQTASHASTPDPTSSYLSSWLVKDSFARPDASSFGTADLGGAYSRVGAQAAGSTTISNNAGVIGNVSPAAAIDEVLSGAVAADVSALLTYRVPKIVNTAFDQYTGLELRRSSAISFYGGRVRITGGNGSLSVVRQMADGTAPYVIHDVSIGHVVSGQKVTIQMVLTGSSAVTVSARAWAEGSAVPSWQSALDPAASAIARSGSVALFGYTGRSSVATTTCFTGFWVSKLTLAGPPMTPKISSAVAGSAAPGSTSYPVPTNATYVSPTGNDNASGSASAPFATVQAAVKHAVSNATIVLRGGTYNQSVTLMPTNTQLTIQSYPGEQVWLDGSIPVTGWVPSGSTWVHAGWDYQFDSSQSFTSGSNAGGFVNSAHPMAANPDQVFFDGNRLAQVSGTPVAGQFAVSYAAHTITVGSDPSGHAVKASNLGKAFVIGGGYNTLRGFGVRNYATSLPNMGTVFVGGTVGHETLENLVIENSATVGLSTAVPGMVINHVTTDYNGMSGMEIGTIIYGQAGAGEIVENCEMSSNNTEGFNVAPAAAGIKVGRIDGIKIVNNVVQNNNQISGIWTDQSVSNFTITGNTVTGNGTCSGCYGIEAELSDTGIIANNVQSGSQYGITAFDTGNVKIFNNVVSGNTVWGVGLTQDARRQATSGLAPEPSVPWIVQNVTVANNVFGPGRGFQFYAFDKATNRAASVMNITVAGDLFSATSTTADPVMVGWGSGDNHTVSYYSTPVMLATAQGKSWANAQESTSGVTTAQMLSHTAALNVAVALPADVAAAIGSAAGTLVVGPVAHS